MPVVSLPMKVYSLDDLFQAKPHSYSATRSAKDTRPPSFFDMHLDTDLQLKRLVRDDTLPQTLAKICNDRIDDLRSKGKLPKDSLGDMNKKLGEALDGKQTRIIDVRDEETVRADYPRRTINPCLGVAAAIAFGLPSWNSKTLKWNTTTVNASLAQCDAYISLANLNGRQILPEDQKRIDLLKKHALSRTLLYEIKNPICGGRLTLTKMVKLANVDNGQFSWITCNSHHFGAHHFCNSDRHSTADTPYVRTGRKTGPDSMCQFHVDTPLPAAGQQDMSAVTKSEPGSERTQFQVDYAKPCYIIQQVWAEMVYDDATYAVVTSGNHELVLRRHRQSQTLYISDVLETSKSGDPAHYHLHTALIVASYLDVIDRANQLERVSCLDPATPWISTYSKNYACDNLDYPTMTLPFGTGLQKITEEKRRISRINCMAKLKRAKQLSVTLPPDILVDNRIGLPTRFIRTSDSAKSWPHPIAYDGEPLDDPEVLHIDSSEARKAAKAQHLSKARVGYLTVPRASNTGNDAPTHFKLMTKFATTALDINDLKRESRMYRFFSPTGLQKHLPASLGLFRSSGGVYVLLLEHVGEPLPSMVRGNLSTELRRQIRVGVQQAIISLHHTGCLHSSLVPEHVLIGNVVKKALKKTSYKGKQGGRQAKAATERRAFFISLKGVMPAKKEALKYNETSLAPLKATDKREIFEYLARYFSTVPVSLSSPH